jgi:acetyltransferase-like isoleucine patch superfamily enzyme
MKKSWADVIPEGEEIHNSVKFGTNVRLGRGVILEEGCEIGDNVFIGHYTIMRPGTRIGKDCVVGHLSVFEGDCDIHDRVVIQSQCHITKQALIEEDVFIAPFFGGANTEKIVHGRHYPLVLNAYKIRRAVRIGIGVFVVPGVEIGENSMLGLGAVVTKDVPSRQLWFGNPAHYIRDIPEDEIL